MNTTAWTDSLVRVLRDLLAAVLSLDLARARRCARRTLGRLPIVQDLHSIHPDMRAAAREVLGCIAVAGFWLLAVVVVMAGGTP